MKHYLLFYETVDDYVERRAPHRAEHLAYARHSMERGEFQIGGAYAEPADGALLIFKGETQTVVEDFARNDPYVLSGLITRWWVREWTTVLGEGAVAPVAMDTSDAVGLRILFVEDNEAFRNIVTKQFLSEHDLTFAGTLAEARERLLRRRFDVVLLDYDLPDGKGIELAEDIAREGCRFVGVSAFAENNEKLKAAGAVAVVGKASFATIGDVLKTL